MIERLVGLPWGGAETFLGIPPEDNGFEESQVIILPVPYEATVSYQTGTKHGPRGIIQASRYVELYDHELDSEPYQVGVHTLPELMLTGAGPEQAISQLRETFDRLLETGKFVIMLGGEHSISSAAILAHADRLERSTLSVLQLDAHADLRTEYEGTPYSHAAVMHRVVDRVDLVQVGIRAITIEERELMRERDIVVVFAHELDGDGWTDRVMRGLGDQVYITFDVDYFDPSIMPATGTPEPGGGTWSPTMRLLERVFRERNVVGCDVVELAPTPGHAASDFTAAKLVYKLIGFRNLALHIGGTASERASLD